MKTRYAVFALCFLALGAVMVPQTMACPICPVEDGDWIKVYAGPDAGRYGTGGNFIVENISQTVDKFLTYCLEGNEYIDFSVPYKVSLATAADGGGFSGGSPDPLDSRTAYLYSNAYFGNLAGLSGITGLALNKAMQEVVWFIEGELPAGTIYDDLSANAKSLFKLADSNAVNGELYGVKVMNLVDSRGVKKQSLLTVCCECPAVPEPSTLAIWGMLGVCGMMVARRRRK